MADLREAYQRIISRCIELDGVDEVEFFKMGSQPALPREMTSYSILDPLIGFWHNGLRIYVGCVDNPQTHQEILRSYKAGNLLDYRVIAVLKGRMEDIEKIIEEEGLSMDRQPI